MSAEPFTAFAFAVELRVPGSDQPLCEAAFCACDGLELRREIIRARDGAEPTNVRLLPGAESFGNVVLRRGMTSSFDLWDWWERVRRGQAARATCDIVVLSPDLAQERVRFRLYRCLPVRLTGLQKCADVTLKRGIIGSLNLYRWLDEIRNGEQNALRTVAIQLQNEDHTEVVMTWRLLRARIIKHVSGPLNAKGTDVAIEQMTLAYERLEIE